MNELLLRFGISLGLTLVIELVAALLLKIRGKELLLVCLVNILTNPVAVLLSAAFGDKSFLQILIEAAVVWIEGLYYKKYADNIEKPYFVSLICNFSSYGLGILVNFATFCLAEGYI